MYRGIFYTLNYFRKKKKIPDKSQWFTSMRNRKNWNCISPIVWLGNTSCELPTAEGIFHTRGMLSQNSISVIES